MRPTNLTFLSILFIISVANNLQNIIQEQIQTLSSGQASTALSDSNSITSSSTTAADSAADATSSGESTNLATLIPTSTPGSGPTPTLVQATPTLNSNAQAALAILLTAQMQSRTGQEASILQNPQIIGILHNLVQSASDPTGPTNVSLTELMSNPVLSPVFQGATQPGQIRPQQPLQQQPATPTSSYQSSLDMNNKENQHNRTTLLDTPVAPSTQGGAPIRPTLLSDPSGSSSSNGSNGQISPSGSTNSSTGGGSGNTTFAPKDASPTPPIVANNLNELLNTKNLNELLGSLNTPPKRKLSPPTSATVTSVSTAPPPIKQQALPLHSQAPPLHPPPGSALRPHLPPIPQSRGLQRPVLLGDAPPSAVNMAYPPPAQHGLYSGPPPQVAAAAAQQSQQHAAAAAQQQAAANQFLAMHQAQQAAQAQAAVQAQAQAQAQAAFAMQQQQQQQFYNPNALLLQQQQQQQQQQSNQQQQQQHLSNLYNQQAAILAQYQQQQPPPPPPPQPQMSQYAPVISNSPILMAPPTSSMFSTPPGNKRKLPIPPSPEQSPEGPYIGQHSQGIGGHYADSYWRKRTKYQ